MSNTYHARTETQIRRVLDQISLMSGLEFNLARSAGMKVILDSPDGRMLNVKCQPNDEGLTVQGSINNFDLVVPSGGAADADVSYGTATMASSKIDITVTAPAEGGDPVPEDAVIYAIAATRGGKVKSLRGIRLSSTQIRVSSEGPGYQAPFEWDTARGTLVAGTLDVTTPVAPATTDLFYVEQISAGGSAANHFSAFRKNGTQVTIQAHDSNGAFVAGNTSVVRLHKIAGGYNGFNRATGTLVAGVATITLANTAGERLLVRQVTAGGTAANHFVVHRVDNTSVKVFAMTAAGAVQTANTSTVEVYDAGIVDVANAVLVSGTLDIPMAVAVGDRLSVVEVTAGGTAANHFSAFRKNATEVTILAQSAAGALVATNTSTVRVYNFGQSGDETSDIIWLVRRP